jgi:hypothetical protein
MSLDLITIQQILELIKKEEGRQHIIHVAKSTKIIYMKHLLSYKSQHLPFYI